MADTQQGSSRSAGQILDGGVDAAPNRTGRFQRDRHRDDVDPRARRRATQNRQREEFGRPRWGSAFSGWLVAVGIATLLTALLSAAGAAVEYNVLSQLNLPRIPVDEGSLTTGGLIALAAIVLGTLLAAVAGGKAGTHFHRKVDRVGLT
jgi:hypothetical protein